MKELSSFDKKYKEKNAVMLYIEFNFGEEALSCFSERRIYDNLENYVKRVKEDDFDFFYLELRKENENSL